MSNFRKIWRLDLMDWDNSENKFVDRYSTYHTSKKKAVERAKSYIELIKVDKLGSVDERTKHSTSVHSASGDTLGYICSERLL